MAKVKLGDWGTYFFGSGTSTPYEQDAQVRYYLTYEQNISTNITTIYVQPYIYCYQSAPITFPKSSIRVTTNINGTVKTQTISTTNTMQTGYFSYWGTTQSFEIKHADNGTASCVLNGTAVKSDDNTTRKCSHTWTLPTINRTSSISNDTTSASRKDFGQTVTFTISRPSTSITHTLTYIENGQTVTIGTGIGDSATHVFKTDYINNIPDSSIKEYNVTCTSSNGTISTTTVYLKVPDSYKPSLTLTVTDENPTTKGWGIWVQNRSTAKITLTPTLSAGSPIKTYYTTVNNTPYYGQINTIEKLSYTGTVNIISNVTDNRNRTSSNATKQLTVYPYSNPTFSKIEVIRCNANGVEDNNGTYGKIKCSYSISSCNNKNIKSLVVTYGSGTTAQTKDVSLTDYSANDKTSGSTYDFTGLGINANHTFTFKLTDSFTTTEQSYVMPPSYVLISQRAGGKGITFGQIATEDGFNVHMNAKFSKILNALAGLTTNQLKLGRVEYSPKTMSELVANASPSNTSFNTGYSHLFWVNWANYETYPGWAGASGFYFQGTQSNSGYIVAIPYQAKHFYVNTLIDGTRWNGWKRYNSVDFIYDGLDSTDANYALSANQGRILNNKINAIPAQKSLQWVTVTTTKTWSQGTVLTYSNVLVGAVAIWIGGKVLASNTGLSALLIPMPLITTTETNFLINDEAQWVRVGMYKDGNNLKVVDRGRGKDGNVSHIYVLKYA